MTKGGLLSQNLKDVSEMSRMWASQAERKLVHIPWGEVSLMCENSTEASQCDWSGGVSEEGVVGEAKE